MWLTDSGAHRQTARGLTDFFVASKAARSNSARAGCSTAGNGLASALIDDYIRAMCGRVIQSGGPLRYAIVDGMNIRDSRVHNYPPPSMTCSEIPYALQGPYELVQTGARSMDLHR